MSGVSEIAFEEHGVAARCPLDGSPLIARERVRIETVPATVPRWYTRHGEAPYRRVEKYERVFCQKKGHEFKRSGRELKGMKA